MSATKKEVLNAIDKVSDLIGEVSLELWQLAEISLREVKSAALLMDVLRKNGLLSPNSALVNPFLGL
jgi:metal-dependent amidase/aminoacylase/carboxypeptidase family protein